MMSQEYYLAKLRQDAQVRWLEIEEALFILQNHERIGFTQESMRGSLCIFNTRVNPNFRNDGYSWRTRPNGIVTENRYRLKIHTERILKRCCTQGNENRFLWRKIYYMTEPDYNHIVLVHYRQIQEGLASSSELTVTGPVQSSCSSGSTKRSRKIVGCSNDNSQQFVGNSYHPTLDPKTIEGLKSPGWLRLVQFEGSSKFTDGANNYTVHKMWEQEEGDFNLWWY